MMVVSCFGYKNPELITSLAFLFTVMVSILPGTPDLMVVLFLLPNLKNCVYLTRIDLLILWLCCCWSTT